jgi:RHS repeat-associated protein
VYDANGNRLQLIEGTSVTSGVYNDQDQLLSYGDLSYTYNQRGQLQSKTNTVTNEVTLYDYDVLGNLLAVTLPDATFIEYLVDGNGRRVGKKVNGTLVKQWVYGDDLRIVAELDGGGNVVSRFVWTGERDGRTEDALGALLARLGGLKRFTATVGAVSGSQLSLAPVLMVRDGNVYRLIADQTGSPRLLVDGLTGAVADRLDYAEWGDLTTAGSGIVPQGFGAGLWDSDTGLVRFGARDYDGQTGRWTTKDPTGLQPSEANLYGYALGDPVNALDPLGLSSCDYYRRRCLATALWNPFGVSYYCAVAPTVCEHAGEGDWANCVRQCLQDLDNPRDELCRDANTPFVGGALGLGEQFPLIVADHAICFIACAL